MTSTSNPTPTHHGSAAPQVKVHYTIVDTSIYANIVHTYISALKAPTDEEPEGYAEDTNKEVVYTFPLPSGAAVCAFSATIEENKVIRGVVKAKEEAKQVYADAVNEGKTAALLEEKRDEGESLRAKICLSQG